MWEKFSYLFALHMSFLFQKHVKTIMVKVCGTMNRTFVDHLTRIKTHVYMYEVEQ